MKVLGRRAVGLQGLGVEALPVEAQGSGLSHASRLKCAGTVGVLPVSGSTSTATSGLEGPRLN